MHSSHSRNNSFKNRQESRSFTNNSVHSNISCSPCASPCASPSASSSLHELPESSEANTRRPTFYRSTAFVPSLFPLHRIPLPQTVSPSVSSIELPPSFRDVEVPFVDCSDSNSSEQDEDHVSPISSTPEVSGSMCPRVIKFATPNINGVRTPCTSPSKSDCNTPKNRVSIRMTLSPDGRVSSIEHSTWDLLYFYHTVLFYDLY